MKRPRRLHPCRRSESPRRAACRSDLAILLLVMLVSLPNVSLAQIGNRSTELGRSQNFTTVPTRDQDNQSDARSTDSAPGAESHYYGVLGSVNRPGVYTTENAQLTLAALVTAAQGLTQNATELVSVVRNGRERLEVQYPLDSDLRLAPGDVIVVGDRRHPPQKSVDSSLRNAGHDADGPTIVAFVGLIENRPIVSSLEPEAATLPHLIANLYQRPEVLQSVRVIHGDRLAERAESHASTDRLNNADVVIFDPVSIDYASLARTSEYPPAIPIQAGNSHAPDSQWSQSIPQAVNDTEKALQRSLSIKTHQPPLVVSGSEVLADTSASDLPTILPNGRRDSSTPEFPNEKTGESMPDRQGVPPAPETAPLQFPVDLSLVSQAISSPADWLTAPVALAAAAAEEKAVAEMSPSPSLENENSETAEQQSLSPTPLAVEEPVGRVSAAEDAAASSPRVAYASHDSHIESNIPAPEEAGLPVLASRATTLGISVLLIAALCFIGSLLWSKFDRTSGQTADEDGRSDDENLTSTSIVDRAALENLLANRLPMIEEQTCLPEQLAFHGEAIGRRRIRIDARHKGQTGGPHFSQDSGIEQVSAPAAANTEEHASVTAGPLRDDDAHTTSSPNSAGNSRQASQPISQRGLLERVLMAMEREKRR